MKNLTHKIKIHGGAACISFAVLLIGAGASHAQTTISLEEAWNRCVKMVGETTGTNNAQGVSKTAAMKACLTKLGHPEGK